MARIFVLAGLGFGDEGKGTTTDLLCRHYDAKLVVRYNGGSQAAHNVLTDDGRHHTFAQFGSGTFAGASTLLSRHMLINPITFLSEAKALADLHPTVYVERDALVTTPFHVAANRIREMSRTGRHGSCGMGVGETMADFIAGKESLFIRDLEDPATLAKKLVRMRDRKRDEIKKLVNPEPAMAGEWALFTDANLIQHIIDYYAAFCDRTRLVGPEFLNAQLAEDQTVIFEGAQGVLLDQDFGFQPHTTWTDCTFGNAMKLLDGTGAAVTKLGILRSYMTRHGAGPFPSESGLYNKCSEHDHNTLGAWQGSFRNGAFDLVLAKYALEVVGGIDGFVMTHLDRLEYGPSDYEACVEYREHCENWVQTITVRRPADLDHQTALTSWLNEDILAVYQDIPEPDFARAISERLNVKLAITSHGPKPKDKKFIDGFDTSV